MSKRNWRLTLAVALCKVFAENARKVFNLTHNLTHSLTYVGKQSGEDQSLIGLNSRSSPVWSPLRGSKANAQRTIFNREVDAREARALTTGKTP
jgi:hypothetical protein